MKGRVNDLEQIEKLIENIFHTKVLNSIVIILISIILYNAVTKIFVKTGDKTESKRKKTYLKLIKSIIRYVFIIVTTLILLQINGIDVSSMLAGVGIASVIIGFAVQDVLKDIIKGFSIISDKYFQVGDVVKYNEIEGKVYSIGIRTTKIEDVYTLNKISIANRNIEQVEVVSNLINIDIPIPYEVKVEDAEKAIGDILERINYVDGIDKCEYRGVNKLDESSINYQIKVYCDPFIKVQKRRDALRCILLGLADNNIEVPYKQIDIHNKTS